MTLVEMLVAMTATLILMAAIAQVFGAFGTALSANRAMLNMAAQMRAVAWQLRADLAGATATPLPPLSADMGAGYLEIVEGPNSDSLVYRFYDTVSGSMAVITSGSFAQSSNTPYAGSTSDDRLLGDCDDVLLLTTSSRDAPFTGFLETATAESTTAEVAWFARPTPGTSNPVTYTLYRRQLLVLGYIGSGNFAAAGTNSRPWSDWNSWRTLYETPLDLSVRREGATVYPNTLADLTRREFRFMHNPSGIESSSTFPYAFVDHLATVSGSATPTVDGLVFDASGPRRGDDVVLTDVLAFDIRVFDPTAPVAAVGDTAIVPGDPGYLTAITSGTIGLGAYVDLGNGERGRFSDYGQPRSGLAGTNSSPRTFDTWSTHYETNEIDEDLQYGPDQGTNGNDDDRDGKIDEIAFDADRNGRFDDPGDDPGESETLPPYPYPLRGIEIRIRCYDRPTRQVRQVTVRHSFVPH